MERKNLCKEAMPFNNQVFLRNVISILSLYWGSEEKIFAWSALIALVILSLLAVATAVAINEWYNYFYNAIQNLDAHRFYIAVAVFFAIITFSVLRSVLITYLVNVFALRWRRWLTNYYISAWGANSPRPDSIERCIDNPDQRIAEDINKFTFETIDLVCGLIYTLASIVSFSAVLVSISGSASILGVVVPAYMFWVAMLYSFVGMYIIQKIGFKLVLLSGKQQRYEADLRYLLIRFRDRVQARSIDIGFNCDKDCIGKKLNLSIINMRRIIRVRMHLSLFSESYSHLSLVVSNLLAIPRFFSGNIMLGDVMQINSAFGNLCDNLNWFINVYHRFADWRATADRLISFDRSLSFLDVMNSTSTELESCVSE